MAVFGQGGYDDRVTLDPHADDDEDRSGNRGSDRPFLSGEEQHEESDCHGRYHEPEHAAECAGHLGDEDFPLPSIIKLGFFG